MVGMKFLALRLNAVYARKYVHVRAGISFFQAEDCIRDHCVTGVQTCALPIFAAFIKEALAAGIAPREIGVFTRAPEMLNRARAAVHSAGGETLELSDRTDDPGERVSIGTMHLAKGLEFKA